MAAKGDINTSNLLTLASVAILVGTELVGAGWAAGWALGGLFQLGATLTAGLEALFIGLGVAGLIWFMRAAMKAEPIYS